MTDSELLALARNYTDKAIRNDDWLKFDLARFVADYLDDSPVTEEALREMGFYYLTTSDSWVRGGTKGRFELFTGDIKSCQWIIGDTIVAVVYSIGQLRHLLRGLGVGV